MCVSLVFCLFSMCIIFMLFPCVCVCFIFGIVRVSVFCFIVVTWEANNKHKDTQQKQETKKTSKPNMVCVRFGCFFCEVCFAMCVFVFVSACLSCVCVFLNVSC